MLVSLAVLSCICGRSINSKDEERMRGGRRRRVVYSPKVRKNRNSSGNHSFEIAELGDGQEDDDHTAPTKKKTKMPPSEQRSCLPSSNAEEILEEKVRTYVCFIFPHASMVSQKSSPPPLPPLGLARKERKYSNRLVSSSWSQMQFSMG